MDLSIFDKDYQHKFEVSQAVYDVFQQCRGNYNPLHTNLGFVKAKVFPQYVMYGNIL